MQGGTIDLNVMNASLLAGNVKEMAILDFPYLFNSSGKPTRCSTDRSARSSWTSCPRADWSGWPTWIWVSARCTPTQEADHQGGRLKGLKMRVIPTPIYVDFMTLRAPTRSRCPSPRLTARWSKARIDGMTNPLLNILDGKYNEVTKHLTLTNHMYTPQSSSSARGRGTSCRRPTRRSCRDAAVETTAFSQRKVARERSRQGARPGEKGGHDGTRAAARRRSTSCARSRSR